MSDRDDREPSFDPLSWLSAPEPPRVPPVPQAAQGGEPSFDPRSWAAAPTPPRDAVRTPQPRPEAPGPGGAPASHGLDRRRATALVAGGAIAATGVLAAWRSRPVAVAGAAMTAPAPASSRRMLTVAGPAAIVPSLLAAGIVPGDAAAAGGRAAAAMGSAAGDLRLVFDLAGPPRAARLLFLEATHGDGSGLSVTRRGDDFVPRRYDAHLVTRLDVVRGRLDTASFYSAAVAAGLRDTLVSDFAGAFAFDFDFQREIGPGDRIVAGYEQRYSAAGDPVGVPVLAYAALATAAKARALYRFAGPGDRAPGWYDAAGHSVVRALMRTPVDGARISSPFGMRDHPILGFVKMHKGTDFAAPVGTPIFAAGDAVVEFAGPKGPNGNFVKLRHDNGWETLYLHMNRIWPEVTAGARVRQGEQIGEVGTTGRSTGPHLHYEVHIAGEPVNPLTIDTGTGKALAGAALAAFRRERARIDARLALAAGATPGSGAAPAPPAARRASPS